MNIDYDIMKTLREIFNQYIVYKQNNGKVITKDSYQPIKSIIYFIENKKNTPYLNQSLFNEWRIDKPRSYNVMTVVRAFLLYAREEGLRIRCAKPKYQRGPKKYRLFEQSLTKSIISDMLQKYIDWKKSTYPLNAQYHYHLIRFNNFCYTAYPDAKELNNEIIDAWCALKKNESAVTRNSRVTPIANFVTYAQTQGWTNISKPMPLPVRIKTSETKHIFTHVELKEFFYLADRLPRYSTEPDIDYKTRSIVIPVFFRMLYSTGMRNSEMVTLKRSDVDIEKGIIMVFGISRQPNHRVILSESMRKLLEDYDNKMDNIIHNREPFFPNAHGGFLSNSCITKNFAKLWNAISEKKAEVADFRVTYAVENIRKWDYEGTEWNIELLYLSRSMGHKNVSATEKYLSLVPRFSKTLSVASGNNLKRKLPNLNTFKNNEEENEQ